MAKKFTLIQTTFIFWFVGFVFRWLVIGNMYVLQFAIQPNIFDAFLASLIINIAKV